MKEILPINIKASSSLLKRYKKLSGAINKQEAQINFQTLAAGWYEDENNISTIEIFLICSDEYQEQLAKVEKEVKNDIADDVFLYLNNNHISCYVAITDVETKFLDEQPKILSSYLTIKIKKVINAIAEKKNKLALI